MSNKADMTKHDGNIVVVLGMHRSGTSAFTGALKIAGFDLGKDIMQANDYNVKGYFENNKIKELNDKILGYFNASWDSMFFLPEKWEEDERLMQSKLDAIEIINSEFDRKNKIAIKDPRFGILLSFWKSVFETLQIKPNYCVLLRSPIEISLSLENREHFSIQKSHILWTNYLMAIELSTRAEKRIFIDFPDFLKSPIETLKRHSRYFKLKDSFPLPEIETEIEEFVDPKLRHHNSPAEKTSDKIPAMVNDYFILLKQLTKNEKSDKTILTHLDQFYTEYQRISKFFYNKEITNIKDVEELRDNNDKLSKHAAYLQNLLDGTKSELEKNEIALDQKDHALKEEARINKLNADSYIQIKNILSALQTTVLEHKNIITDREKTIKNREETIEKRDTALNELRKKIFDSNEKYNIAHDHIKHLNTLVNNANSAKDEIAQTVNHQKNELAEHKKVINELSYYNKDLKLDGDLKEKVINELKSSVSLKIGWALTSPARWIYNLFGKSNAKFHLFTRFLPIIFSSPLSAIKHLNSKNIKRLRIALKNEPLDQIANNLKNLLDGGQVENGVAETKKKPAKPKDTYQVWIKNNTITTDLRAELYKIQKDFNYRPLISIVIPVYNVEEIWFEKAIKSIEEQIYDNWELCLADDKSTKKEIKPFLKKLTRTNSKIKIALRKKNGGISAATNDAIKIATGEYLIFMDNDDALAENALFEIVKVLNENPKIDVLYSDEDKIDEQGNRYDPNFKPDWSPELFLSYYYFNHLTCVRKSICEKAGFLRSEYDSCQDWDLLLRVTSLTNKIYHIPKVLYHWRAIEGSIAKEGSAKVSFSQFEKCKKLLKEHLLRINKDAKVIQPDFALKGNLALFNLLWPNTGPKVSILIPSKDHYATLKKCIDSLEKTTYQNFEIIILDNDSTDPKTLHYLSEIKNNRHIKVVKLVNKTNKFSYANINNEGVRIASGELILLLNDDTVVISSEWLSQMVGYHKLDGVGAVGAKLLYPDNTIQHAGVINGLYFDHFSNLPDHAFKHLPAENVGYGFYTHVTRNYSAVTAACLLISKKLFTKINGFDEVLFPLAYNDIDLCMRILQNGKRVVYCNDAILMHHESKSRKQILNIDEPLNFKNKYRSFIDPYYNDNLSKMQSFAINPINSFDYKFPSLKKPKVILISHNLNFEGAPIQLFEIVESLQKRGRFNFEICSPSDGPLRKKFENIGINVHLFEDPVTKTLLDTEPYNDNLNTFSNWLKSLNPDIIFANTVVPFYVHEASRNIGCASLWLIHEGFTLDQFFVYLPEELKKKAIESFQLASSVIFVSKAGLNLYQELNNSQSFVVIKNAVKSEKFIDYCSKHSKDSVRTRLGFDRDVLNILNLGTICERKGQLDFTKAAVELLKEGNTKFHFVMVGARDTGPTGEYLNQIKKIISDNSFENYFTIIPETNNVEPYFRASDIFVCSSYNETYGRVIMEAMLCSLPVITTPVLGIPEVTLNGVNSLHYNPGNIQQLKNLIMQLANSEKQRIELALNSPKMAAISNSFEEMTEKYADIIYKTWLSAYKNQ